MICVCKIPIVLCIMKVPKTEVPTYILFQKNECEYVICRFDFVKKNQNITLIIF